MKNNNVDIKSLIIGFLMATCMMMALGANSKPVTVSFPDTVTLYQGGTAWDVKHSGYIQ
jgi:hypothetical protein